MRSMMIPSIALALQTPETQSMLISALLLVAFSGLASAFDCVLHDATRPSPLLNYPLPSNKYAVQYKVGNGTWTPATTYTRVYGGTIASPYRGDSGYSPSQQTSLSFASIPAQASSLVQLRVTKLFDTPVQT